MSDYFIFGGVDTRTFNAAVYRQNVETVGPQLYKVYEVPGRNGDILLPEGRYPNRKERYNILITGTNAAQNMDDLKNALLAITGYARLEDSFDTDVFYSAALIDDFDIVYDRERTAVKCLITFNRKPQKFLKTGEHYTFGHNIENPTLFISKPLIRVTGDGSITIGDQTIDVGYGTSLTGETWIDCETKECYGGNPTEDRSAYVRFFNNDYPVLAPGWTALSWSSGVTDLAIIGRWWKL